VLLGDEQAGWEVYMVFTSQLVYLLATNGFVLASK